MEIGDSDRSTVARAEPGQPLLVPSNIVAMAAKPITLEFLARHQQRLLNEMGSMRDEMGSMRDDMQVLTAMVMRRDGTVGLVLTELRVMHSQHQRIANRVRPIEEQPAQPK